MDELRIEYEKNQSGMGTIAFGVVGLVRGASAPRPLPHNSAQALPPIPLQQCNGLVNSGPLPFKSETIRQQQPPIACLPKSVAHKFEVFSMHSLTRRRRPRRQTMLTLLAFHGALFMFPEIAVQVLQPLSFRCATARSASRSIADFISHLYGFNQSRASNAAFPCAAMNLTKFPYQTAAAAQYLPRQLVHDLYLYRYRPRIHAHCRHGLCLAFHCAGRTMIAA
jgi:hypothetical protein